ncbi:hypothetical protein ASE04_14755 [Rhizobium sp. Root708]|nr:hypothetical protein ASE04_14755 [Rhizobium sp. Root708]
MNLFCLPGPQQGNAVANMGNNLFKIAKTDISAPLMPGSLDLNDNNPEMLAQFSVAETWTGDFSSGTIRLRERSAMLHGLTGVECGLLSLLRCYDRKDHAHILDIFEQASTLSSSSFCFSTTIIAANGHRQPLFCMGESNGYEDGVGGSILGVFIFPRFKSSTSGVTARRQ